jgi:hypothetical protein
MSLRAVFLLKTGFVDDDAYHWTWTQKLDWSYFDHPGMIAWLEAFSTGIFGQTPLGIRLPCFLIYGAVVVLTWRFVRELFDEKAATFAAALFLFAPLWGFGGLVSSPEAPFMLLWLLATRVFWKGVHEGPNQWSLKKTWLTLGLIMGLGFNTKFPIVLLAPGFGLYLLSTPERRKDLLKPWPWVGILVSVILLAPVLYWNIHHDWPSFRYQFHDRHADGGFEFKRWLGFLGSQIAVLSPGLYFSVLIAFVASFFKWKNPRWRLLACLSLPSFLVFYPQPLWADYKPHWMGAAYFLLTFGVAALWSQGWQQGEKTWIQPKSRKMFWSIWSFIIVMNILIYAPVLYPWVPKVARMINQNQTFELKNDPSNDLFGWPEAGKKLLELQSKIEAETGNRPFLAGTRYELTAQTWKATMQRTYMLSTTVSYYTTSTTEAELDSLLGHTALFVTTDRYPRSPLDYADFDSCEVEEFSFYREDELARKFFFNICRNFKGIKK